MLFEKRISELRRIKNYNACIFLVVIIAVIIALTGCSATKGSIVIRDNTSETSCSMDFKDWSSNNKWEIYLSQGEQLKIEVDHAFGEIDLAIYGKNGSLVYMGSDLKSCMFTVTASDSDDYVIEICGIDATGSLSVNKKTDSSQNDVSSGDDTAIDNIDVPKAVLSEAKDQVANYFNVICADIPEHQYTDWRIEKLEWVYIYAEADGMDLDIYCMNYEFLSEAPENIILAGGMYITEDNWVCPTYPNCTYLVFNADSNAFLFAMMENDCYPGDELFTEDLLRKLSSS